MEQDSAMAQCYGYGGDSWVSISPYNHSPYDDSPMNECAGFTQFMSHHLPESTNGMPPPSRHHLQLIQPAPPAMCHHQLPMLNTAWPSQLTNPTPTSGPPSNPAPPPSAATPGKGTSTSQVPDVVKQPGQPDKIPRKTLSAEQKRAMCQYHDENPGTRQADIGAKFGVERSTVSKVLRHRDQYLKREQDADFAFKRAKGKHPDFDRTLSNYVRRQQQRGFDIEDDEIMEQAKLFARASGNQEGLLSTLTGSWLLKFKQKHGIGSGRLMRRASETNIPDSARMSTALAALQKVTTAMTPMPRSAAISPTSPTPPLLSPLSWSRSDEDLHRETLDFELTYRAQGSQRDTSMASDEAPRGNGASTLSACDTISPAASYNFSPDPSSAGAFPLEHQTVPANKVGDAPGLHYQRGKRSKTFPSIDVSFVHHETVATEALAEPTTPRHHPPVSSPSSSVQSPASDLRAAAFAVNTSLTSPPSLHRTSSNSSLTGRSSGTPVTGSTVAGTMFDSSSPDSPTLEEARQAANILLSYIRRMSPIGQFDQSEFLAVVQLTNKLQLQLQQHQSSRPSIGGLSRIPEGDHEMPLSVDAATEVR
ncbi:tc5 transposase DNA-binding domain-containing protein [Hirsutella rhossiliensis]|uniref:Tc5 transposase DNA-binding domain-containing protein n=1 Tax=Hirsutella rhossiliensis TaxID=111463 RepID=A0A9P8N4F8_9HYPO|nr:tc5 transposase DNA-binding domain-containing protein [Hirsutella rhossiliensis]KAH0966767.1 tc5 transposase DNA-binding domain-containing protein [Hirsutella rhossiliensis]